MIDSIEDLGVWAVGYLATVWGSTAEHSGTFQLSLTRPRSPLPTTVHAQHLVALLGRCLGAPFTKQAGLASRAVGTKYMVESPKDIELCTPKLLSN